MGRDVKVRFIGQDEVTATLKKIEGGVKGFADSVKTVLAGLGVALSAAALGNFFKSAIEGAAIADKANRQLAQSLENVGGKYEALKPAIDATVASVQQLSVYDDDSLTNALTTLISISGKASESLKNLQVTADLASARQIDLKTAAELVGKVMAGETSTLKRYGIVVAEGADAMQVLRDKFGGFAAAEAQSLQGVLARLKNNWDDFAKAVGRALTGSEDFSGGLNAVVTGLKDLEHWVVRNEAALQSLADFITGTFSVAIRVGVIAPVNVLTTAFEGLGALSDTLAAGWLELVQRLKGIVGEFARIIGTALESVGATGTGDQLQKLGDRMVLDAAREYHRVQNRLDELLNQRYNRTSGRDGAQFTSGSQAGGGGPGGGPGTPIDNVEKGSPGTNQRGNLGLTTFGRPGGEPGQSPSGIPDFLQGSGAGQAAAQGAGQLVQGLDAASEALKGLTDGFATFGQGAEDAFAQAVAAGKGFGGGLAAVKQQLAKSAVIQGLHDQVAAISALARGLFGDPTQFAAAARLQASAAKWFAFSSLLGGGGGGGGVGGGGGGYGGYGGSGGLGPGQFATDQRNAQQNRDAQITVKAKRGALLNLSSPEGQQLVAEVYRAGLDRRVLELDLTGGTP